MHSCVSIRWRGPISLNKPRLHSQTRHRPEDCNDCHSTVTGQHGEHSKPYSVFTVALPAGSLPWQRRNHKRSLLHKPSGTSHLGPSPISTPWSSISALHLSPSVHPHCCCLTHPPYCRSAASKEETSGQNVLPLCSQYK